MKKTSIACCGLVSLFLTAPRLDSKPVFKTTYLTVAAGNLDRRESIVRFAIPKTLKAKSYVLRDDAGKAFPVQVDADGTAAFVLPELKASATKRFRLEEAPEGGITNGSSNAAQAIRDGDHLTVTVSGRKALTFQGGPGELPSSSIKPVFRQGGYIHPVFTPSGRIVTDDYPPDHFHHHGIWFAWTKTEFQGRHPDFWNVGDGTGKVEFVALDQSWSGPVHAGFKSRNRSLDVSAPSPVTVLNEQWLVTVYNVGQGSKPFVMFDLVSTQDLATDSPLILPEYRYGGLGFRGHRQWLAKDNCEFLTSEGKDRSNGHGTRARWCHIGGKIDGQPAGIAILDHPSNFRAPQAMRINPDQPFFCYSPSLTGDWRIEPGKSYVSRYRFVVYDGAPDRAELDRVWNDYANPVTVTISQ
ncbi:MAG TPA: PmoA family protein [Blastocatellia bacterium]|nr:PmoA family protein [Blastocatellia bacterium]